MVEILTSRLRLIPLTVGDHEELVALHSDPAVVHGSTGAAVPRTRTETADWLRRTLMTSSWEAGRETFRVEDRSSGTFLGRCGLRPDAHSGDTEIAYAFVRAAWGRGIATEAVRAVLEWGAGAGLARVVATVVAGNIASQRVLLKAGMNCTGRMPTSDGALVLYALDLGGPPPPPPCPRTVGGSHP